MTGLRQKSALLLFSFNLQKQKQIFDTYLTFYLCIFLSYLSLFLEQLHELLLPTFEHLEVCKHYMGRAKRIWYLSPMRAAKVQASLRIRAVSPEPSLLAHTSSESRGTFRQKARSLAPLNGWACAVKVCHDGMLEDTNSLGAAHISSKGLNTSINQKITVFDIRLDLIFSGNDLTHLRAVWRIVLQN